MKINIEKCVENDQEYPYSRGTKILLQERNFTFYMIAEPEKLWLGSSERPVSAIEGDFVENPG